MMHGDVNRRKWRWSLSAHVRRVHGQVTFHRNGSHTKNTVSFSCRGLIMKTDEGQKGDLNLVALQIGWNEELLKQNDSENWASSETHMLTYMGTYLHMQPLCSEGAARQKVMTLPLSVWAAGAIDRWHSRLFTVKAPSIALLRCVTFNRVPVVWNSAPCTFHTIQNPFSLQYVCSMSN